MAASLIATGEPTVQPAGGLFGRPSCLRILNSEVMPRLRSYALPNIWLAEATGPEDVLAMTAMLQEHGLARRARMYVTAAHDARLRQLQDTPLSLARLAACEEAYHAAGGISELNAFVTPAEGQATLRRSEGIVWAQHCLETDASFNEFDLIVCLRPLAHLAPAYRPRVLRLFAESLPLLGMLCMTPALPAPHLPGFTGAAPHAGYYRRAL